MRCLHDVDERGDVVVGGALALEHGGDERVVDDRRPVAAGGGVGGRHDAERGVGLGRQQLDLEPAPEARRVGPDRGHLRGRVAVDHAAHDCQST